MTSHDPEKQVSENSASPQGLDTDGPVSHPGVSTLQEKDQDKEQDKGKDSDSSTIHSHTHSSIGSISPIPDQDEDIQEAGEPPLSKTKSKSSSVRSRAVTIVPRAKRRGLLARLTVIPEVERPYEYKRSTKWFITFQVAIAAAAAPMGSAILLRKSEHPISPDLLTQSWRYNRALTKFKPHSQN